MNADFLNKLEGKILDGDFPRFLSARNFADPFSAKQELRTLSPKEITILETAGNSCPDWSLIRVSPIFLPNNIRNCRFTGPCRLGLFEGNTEIRPGTEHPAGLYSSVIGNCIIGDGVLILSCNLVDSQVIGDGAVLCGCGLVTSRKGHFFGQDAVLNVGPEVQGRCLPLYCELGLNELCAIAEGQNNKDLLGFGKKYLLKVKSSCGYIGARARILQTQSLDSSFIGDGAIIEGAASITESILFSSAEESTVVGDLAVIRQSVLQWGTQVKTGAVCEKSFLLEHSRAERYAKITDSVLGPNTSAGAGEITASLIGPFVAAHHQSLVISVLWPEGRGNIGYGANCGSNHTGRLPDQEARPGEGLFIGLGASLKFPCDFTDSPYSLIGTGITTLPQKVSLPFSLLNTPSFSAPELSPAFNEIFPGWLIGESAYTLFRACLKFSTRNKARRHIFDGSVFRSDLAEKVLNAYLTLKSLPEKEIYTPSDCPALGKNFMTLNSRNKALAAYEDYLRFCSALLMSQNNPDTRLNEKLKAAGINVPGEKDFAGEWKKIKAQWEKRIRLSREKDFEREQKIFGNKALGRDANDAVMDYFGKI